MQQLKIHPKYLLSSPKITVHNQTQIAKEEEEEKKKRRKRRIKSTFRENRDKEKKKKGSLCSEKNGERVLGGVGVK